MSLSDLDINTDYPCSSGNYTNCTSRTILYIVMHYTGSTGTGKANAKYFMTSGREASAHLFVGNADEDAQIYQSVDLVDKAWHCGTSGTYYHDECRNSNSIGIELACHNDTSDTSASSGNWYFDDETIDKAVELVKALMEEYDIDVDHVIRHYDVTHKVCPAPYVVDETAWTAFKARLTETTTTTTTDEEDDDMVRYEKLSDIPNDYGFQDVINTLMDAKVIKGDGSDATGNTDVIDLSHDQVRSLVFEYRGGAFDRALIAAGMDPVISA